MQSIEMPFRDSKGILWERGKRTRPSGSNLTLGARA
jgi:hypothetical protein